MKHNCGTGAVCVIPVLSKLDKSTNSDTIHLWLESQKLSQRCGAIQKGFGLAIFAMFVIFTLASHAILAAAIMSIRHRGKVIPVSTSKMIRGQRKPIRSNKFCEQSIDWRRNVTLKNDRYTYRVTWSEEDEEYVGLCLEFPSLSWLAATPETALEGIRRVVAEVVTEMQANGETPPTPFAIKQYSGRFMVRIPPDEHRRLALEAAEAGISLNRLVSAKLGQ